MPPVQCLETATLKTIHEKKLVPATPAVSAATDAPDDRAELARKLPNLISIPFQNNRDFGLGPAKAMKASRFGRFRQNQTVRKS